MENQQSAGVTERQVVAANDLAAPRQRSYAGEAWRQLKRNKASLVGLAILAAMVLAAVLAPVISPYDPILQDSNYILKPPQSPHLLGTDRLGRDLLSRILFGARVSLGVGSAAVLVALLTGVPIGLVSAYAGGRVDDVLQRFTDLMMSLPSLILAIAIVAALGPSLVGMVIAIAISAAPGYIRLTRSLVLTLISRDFVTAARCTGVGKGRIILRHLLPNSLGPIIVQSTLGLGGAILMESGLSFLGLGAQPPTPSWGKMIAEGREFLYVGPHMITIPGIFIMVTILSFNLIGDGLRDALDPRLRGR